MIKKLKTTTIILFFFLSFSFYGQNDTISIIKHSDSDLIIPKSKKYFLEELEMKY